MEPLTQANYIKMLENCTTHALSLVQQLLLCNIAKDDGGATLLGMNPYFLIGRLNEAERALMAAQNMIDARHPDGTVVNLSEDETWTVD